MSPSRFTIEQLSVFLENRSGCLSEVLHILAAAGINIRALSLSDTSDFGILRLILSEPEMGKQLLKDNGFTLGKTNVVAVEVDDSPGGLDSVLKLISSYGINVEYMYAFTRTAGEKAIMIFRFDKLDLAIDILQKNYSNILAPDQI